MVKGFRQGFNGQNLAVEQLHQFFGPERCFSLARNSKSRTGQCLNPLLRIGDGLKGMHRRTRDSLLHQAGQNLRAPDSAGVDDHTRIHSRLRQSTCYLGQRIVRDSHNQTLGLCGQLRIIYGSNRRTYEAGSPLRPGSRPAGYECDRLAVLEQESTECLGHASGPGDSNGTSRCCLSPLHVIAIQRG